MESYAKINLKGITFTAYCYEANNGEKFEINRTSLNQCRAEKNLWLVKKFENSIYSNN